jgi:hypothetical protein
VHGGHEDGIRRAFSGDIQSAHIERLRVDVAVDREFAEFPELARIDGLRRKYGFANVGTGAVIVVIIGEDVDLRRCREGAKQGREFDERAQNCLNDTIN